MQDVISLDTNKDLNYKLYLQKTSGFTRSPLNNEFQRYKLIQAGDVEAIKKGLYNSVDNYLEGKGTLSTDNLRNMVYHLVITTAIIARVCIEGGLSHDEAFTLSDIYILRGDNCKTPQQALSVIEEMQIDFATRMKLLKKDNIISIHIRKCVDYIYEHLHEKLTVERLADVVGLNASYLSRLFSDETGVSIKKFIQNAKTETAKNLLRYSDFSQTDISLALGFSSQSAFINVFKNATGMTPRKYRTMYFSIGDIVPEK